MRTLSTLRATLPAVLLLGWAAGVLAAHPLHTTLGELTYDAATREVQVVIRVFEDDFNDAVARAPRPRGPGDARVVYLATHFQLRGPDGRPVPLRWTEARRGEGVLWITLRGRAPAGLRGGTVRHELIHDLHADQVNVLKARIDGGERTLLFTRGAGAKRLG